MPTVVTRELIDQMLDMHKRGMTCVSIAKELNIGKTTVNKYIKIYGEDIVNTDKFTVDFVDKMFKEYQSGKTIAQLAKENKVSASSLSNYIYRKKVESQKATKTAEPKTVEPKATETKVEKPKTIEHETTKTKVEKPKTIEPETTETKVVKPKTVEPETTETSENILVPREEENAFEPSFKDLIKNLKEKKEIEKSETSNTESVDKSQLKSVEHTEDLSKRKTLIDEFLHDEKQVDIMVRLYQTGTSLSEIARLTGLGRTTVTRKIYERIGIANKKLSVQSAKETPKPRGSVSVAIKPWSLEEKIEYCNKQYGEGRWRFLTKEEVMNYLKEDGLVKGLVK